MGMKLAGIMLLIMMVVGGIGYWYYQDTQEKMAILVANEAKATLAATEAEKATKSLQEDYQKITNELNRINNEFASIRKQNNVLSKKLSKHDLGNLGSKKPSLVERIINNASAKVGRCFELESGAKLTEKEKNAKTGKAFNSECPWLFNDLVAP